MGSGVDRWGALEHDNPIGQISGHDEIVLYNETSLLGVQNISAICMK
jgi:hypothetical protein